MGSKQVSSPLPPGVGVEDEAPFAGGANCWVVFFWSPVGSPPCFMLVAASVVFVCARAAFGVLASRLVRLPAFCVVVFPPVALCGAWFSARFVSGAVSALYVWCLGGVGGIWWRLGCFGGVFVW